MRNGTRVWTPEEIAAVTAAKAPCGPHLGGRLMRPPLLETRLAALERQVAALTAEVARLRAQTEEGV